MTDKTSFIRIIIHQYSWKIASLISGMLSMLFVIPFLSSNKDLYGTYLFCYSFVIYLTYADFGFLGSAQKYIGEEYILGNREEESRILGFSIYILIIFLIPFIIFMFWASLNPESILPGLDLKNKEAASKYFLILGLGMPIQVILQRVSQTIFTVRIKEYIPVRIEIIGNIIKVISVFYFFNKNKYQINEYLVFTFFISILSSCIPLLVAKFQQEISFQIVFSSIKFQKRTFNKLKKLAVSSFILSLSWILIFEMDLIIVGSLSNVKTVAIYGIAFSLLNFLRSVLNIIMTPLGQRINQIIALGSFNQASLFIKAIINLSIPVSVIFVILSQFNSSHIILNWVGNAYVDSVGYLRILMLSAIFLPINNLASYYFTATTDNKYILLTALCMSIVFLFSFLTLIHFFEVAYVLAISKLLALIANTIFAIYYLNTKFKNGLQLRFSYKKLLMLLAIIVSIYLVYSFEYLFKNESRYVNIIVIIFLEIFFILISLSYYGKDDFKSINKLVG